MSIFDERTITTDQEMLAERRAVQRSLWMIASATLVAMVTLLVAAASFLQFLVFGSVHAWHESLLEAIAYLAVGAPVTALAIHLVTRRFDRAYATADVRRQELDDERTRRQFDAHIADAMEMADQEPEVLRVVERSFEAIAPGARVELLLADNSQAQLLREVTSGEDWPFAPCGVETPQECPAARRARVHRFADSAAINACPKLSWRDADRCAATCVPVSVMGRTVGVIHAVTDPQSQLDRLSVNRLESLAQQTGARVGMLRLMAETQLQAETDGLTGLLNRRAFENRFHRLQGRSPLGTAVVGMIDLDHFKHINDTHGHETGDRALRIFAQTLRSTLRAHDLICRRGGEEFAVVIPDCETTAALALIERVQVQLQLTIREAGLPSFTASFGLTSAHLTEDLERILARADDALFDAKRNGRNQVIMHEGDRTEHRIPRQGTRREPGDPGRTDPLSSAALAVAETSTSGF